MINSPEKIQADNSMNNFYHQIANSKKILVIDLGFLGDVIQLIPSLWVLRRSFPNAEIHVVVSSNVVSLFDCFPWVNRVWGYMRYPRHATLSETFHFVQGVRREHFDCLINLNGSDRSGWLGLLSGIPKRLGRVTSRGRRFVTDIFFSHYVDYPYEHESLYIQRAKCLEMVGFPKFRYEFNCIIYPYSLDGTGIGEDCFKTYFHISPFTTADRKELASDVIAGLLNSLHIKYPYMKIILSCASTERELDKMTQLLNLLSFQPWKVFPGNLNLVQLVSVIKNSLLHLSGDTGSMHIAFMTETPTLSWFQPTKSKDWIPVGEYHSVLFGLELGDEDFIEGIKVASITNEVVMLLNKLFVTPLGD